MHDSQAWRRKENMVFLYGYYYAQHLIILAMVMVFSTTVPMITIAGFLFFGMRHLVDSYNLLTVNRKEIDSSSNMFRKVLLNFQFGILLAQLCMISYMFSNSYLSCASFLGVLFFITFVVVLLTNKNLFDISVQDQSIFNDLSDKTVDIMEDSQFYIPIMKWRSEYSHPLTLTMDRSSQPSTKEGDRPKNLVDELKDFEGEFEQNK